MFRGVMKKFLFLVAIVFFTAVTAHAAKVYVAQFVGKIVLVTNEGAVVWLDNQRAGVTTKNAFTINNVSVGNHAVRISKADYYDYVNNNGPTDTPLGRRQVGCGHLVPEACAEEHCPHIQCPSNNVYFEELWDNGTYLGQCRKCRILSY